MTTWLVVKNEQKKYITCYDEMGLCDLNIDISLESPMNTFGGGGYVTL